MISSLYMKWRQYSDIWENLKVRATHNTFHIILLRLPSGNTNSMHTLKAFLFTRIVLAFKFVGFAVSKMWHNPIYDLTNISRACHKKHGRTGKSPVRSFFLLCVFIIGFFLPIIKYSCGKSTCKYDYTIAIFKHWT